MFYRYASIKLGVSIVLILLCFTDHLRAEKPSDSNGKVLVVPIRDQISKALVFFLRRAFQTAEDDDTVKAIIIDMETPGGTLRETEEIISWMRSLSSSGVPIYSYVNTTAQSAGAIICLASDEIFMAPGSRIGSAAPILMKPTGGIEEMPVDLKEKILSDTRALVRGLAQEKGYLPELAVSMVDSNMEVKVGERVVCAEGELLNLTAKEAVEIIPPMEKPLLATAIVDGIEELSTLKDLANFELVRIEPAGAENFASWITLFAPLLMAAAFIGIYLEVKTPGFGIPGIVGIACLILFLFGHYIAGLAGNEEIFLVIIGVTLMVVEILILPGFGIAGILGITALLAGMILAMIPHLPKGPDLPHEVFKPLSIKPYLDQAVFNLAATILVAGVGIYALAKLLPKTPLYNKLVLQTSATIEAGYIGTDVAGNSQLIGCSGITLTPLRPSGNALIENQRVDVVSNGDYIDKDEPVTVIEVNGPKIVVDLVKNSENEDDDNV